MFKNFFKDESGQGMVEYILIIACIAAVLVVLFNQFGSQISALFTRAIATINNNTPK